MSGDHNLCPDAEQTIIGRFGGFADKVRCLGEWAIALPDALETAKAGPLSILPGRKSISASPLGSPATTAEMLDFCARHDIAPVTEELPMSRANEAMERLRSGSARYRIVLENDF